MNEKIVYRCFSKNQKDWLKEKGYEYLFKGLYPRNLKAFWVFIWDFALDQDLQKWKRNNPRFKNNNNIKLK
ncbi:conserved hypothetical protein [Clostridium phage D-1873]|uniref:Uncharacterized protein n=1 Tax=Clostridium botulinum D str. 1873 TaxID=592027 RepID=A0A9P2G5C9_CLOBO|nr:hypothetical protein [Clostridium botulinum]EES90271.1 conserved hypothetical protein [Clostridium phage D-1873]MCD3245351.1 hypothetical protein [Clostridium botulinum C]MCD3261730.1 hypothetical protein [Clostridium botulinum C]QPW56571.1 hypothetical protein IRP61_11015 [Clostridium botulinum]